jgi:hypothetical protein
VLIGTVHHFDIWKERGHSAGDIRNNVYVVLLWWELRSYDRGYTVPSEAEPYRVAWTWNSSEINLRSMIPSDRNS